jgi:polyisoprenyl-teichoic acid--peptidoglycan teichoic acid transferase
MSKPLVRLALILLLVSVACSLPVFTNQPTPAAVSQLPMTASPDLTQTATPFQPIGPTSTSNPRFTATPEPTISPTIDAHEDAHEDEHVVIPGLPTPVRPNLPLPEGQVEILLLGSDWRPNAGYRTDVIMLVSINTKKATVSVVSFPRDLYVTIPGWTTQRINTAQPRGGFEMMADTFDYNFGVRPQYYVMTNFQGFKSIIDSLGGVTVNVGQGLNDTCDLPQARNGYCQVNPGRVTMNGETALWYVRARKTTSDFDRTRRAQEVIYGIFSKMMSLNAITRLPELYNTYTRSVETNMGIEDIAPLLQVAPQILSDSDRVSRYAVGRNEVTPYRTESGAAVLLPNYEAITKLIIEAVFKP